MRGFFIISKQTRARERADIKLPDVRTHTQMYYVVFTSAMPEHRNGGPGAMSAVARTGVQINLEPYANTGSDASGSQ